jgi:hypothetical protein
MSKISKLIDYNPSYLKYSNGFEETFFYEVSFYCEPNKLIHPNLKTVLKCNKCITKLDKMEYEAIQRLNWFLDNYFNYNLENFSKLKTEEICEKYNIKINYFRPYL